MTRRRHLDVEREVSTLLRGLAVFQRQDSTGDLRAKVISFVPIVKGVRAIGASFIPDTTSGKERMLRYLRLYTGTVVEGDELMVVAGIGEWARRVRELRVQEGWPIITGVTVNQLRESLIQEGAAEESLPRPMRPGQYVLERDQQDLAAKGRWETTNGIRRSPGSVQEKILRLLRAYVGQPIHSEVLRYVAGNDKSEWARRTRELRTEEGWPIVTKSTGDPALPVGVYVLERDEQAPPHDRHIPVDVRGKVMRRDQYSCRWQGCGWPSGYNIQFDRRFLEVHHVHQHVEGGSNTDPANLVTLCNVHHDETHRTKQLLLS
ncbi:MAG: HNH endonuclease [Pseudomonadota bacterium]|nr:HNH endonuclease [Pseudomonadota bacterium]